MLEDVWGTAEYYEKRGTKNTVEKFIKSFKEQGMSEEEIIQQLKRAGFETE